MGPSGRVRPHLRLVRGGRAAPTVRPRIQAAAVLPPGRHSRHLCLLIQHTEGAFRAVAEAIGAAVGVTDQELVIARARWFGKGTIERFRLSSVSAVKIHPPAGLRRLHVTADRRLVVLVYSPRAAAGFEAVLALAHRPQAQSARVSSSAGGPRTRRRAHGRDS